MDARAEKFRREKANFLMANYKKSLNAKAGPMRALLSKNLQEMA